MFAATPTGLRNSGRGRMRYRDQNPPHALGTGEPFPLSPLSSTESEASEGRGPHAPPSSCCRGVSAAGHLHPALCRIRPQSPPGPKYTWDQSHLSVGVGCGEGCPPGPLPSCEFTEGFFPFKYFWGPCTWKSGQGQSWSSMEEKFYSISFNNLYGKRT